MTIFNVLELFGGLALFLFGMNFMGEALEKSAGNKLKSFFNHVTSNPFKGFLLGLAVTCIIQSSSATTVMVVGFINSGIMTLAQSISIILGANLGTSITAWILALNEIDGSGSFAFLEFFKPDTFVPIVAFIGMFLIMFQKNQKRKDIGLILVGFAVLMYGMDIMSASVGPLKESEAFKQVLVLFSNPILGVLVGTVFTAIIQSSSASVGILQALAASTGAVSYATAIPIIMGQNIGTCVSAMISSIGASKNAKRAAIVHLSFNVIATLIILPLYYLSVKIFTIPVEAYYTNYLTIAILHTGFKLVALSILSPFSKLLVKLSTVIIRDSKKDREEAQLLDERLLSTPSIAIMRSHNVAKMMAELSVSSLKTSFELFNEFNAKTVEKIHEDEDQVDIYEDKLGTYLVKLSSHSLSEADSAETNKLLHVIGDFERISDHAVSISKSFEEIKDKGLDFSNQAKVEITVLMSAVSEITDLAFKAFSENDLDSAVMVEPLEQVIDRLRDRLKRRHIKRLQNNECTIEMGFILSDLLTNLSRISDHCSNIAGCVLELSHDDLDIHQYLRSVKSSEGKEYTDYYDFYKMKYALSK